MKKLLLLFFTLLTLFSFNIRKEVKAEEVIELNGSKALVMEVTTGKILYSTNEHEKAYPASMTKMMGMYLVLEAINKGDISLDDQVVCSEYASKMGGTQIYLEPGEQMSVEELFKAVAINSANDAIVCLGEYISGSNELFVDCMNKKAKELGMNNTNFNNATGFDDENHYTTTYDMGIIARRLVLDYPMVLDYSKLSEDYIKGNRDEEFWLVNTNKLLKHCDGMDGLKTGYTTKAGYNLASTVKRNGIRVISVVMNEKSIQERSQDTIKLVNYGFSKLKVERIYEKNQVVGKYCFPMSMGEDVELVLDDNVDLVVEKEYDLNSITSKIEIEDCILPLKKGDVVGNLVIELGDGTRCYYKIKVNEDVEKKSFIKIWMNNILRWII